MNAAQPRRRQGRLLRVTAWLEVRPGPSRGPYLGHCVGDSKAGKIVKDSRLHHCHAPNRSAPYPTGMTPRSVAPATPPSGAGSLQTRAAVGDRDPRQETQTSSRMSELEPRQIDRRNGVCMVAQECPPVCDGGPRRRIMYLETVDSAIPKPSFSSSPWMRGAPHNCSPCSFVW